MNRSRTILLAFLPVLLLATVLLWPDGSAHVHSGAAAPAAGPLEKIRADVVEALAREDWVRVIITLQEPAAAPASTA